MVQQFIDEKERLKIRGREL